MSHVSPTPRRRSRPIARNASRALLIAGVVVLGLLGLALTRAAADDGGPRGPEGGWPQPTPATITRTVTQPAQTVTTTITRTATETQTETETATETRTRTKTQPPPVWTEPNLPVTGARPGVVAGAAGAGLLLIAVGVGLLVWRRRRDKAPAEAVA